VGPGHQRDKKKRKRDSGRGQPRGKGLAGCWATGSKGKRGKFPFFSFFSFSNPFQIILLNSNSNQTFSNFSQNFINILEFTQATKNHAKPNNDAQSLVVSRLNKLNLII
jgi:hypothetical protein